MWPSVNNNQAITMDKFGFDIRLTLKTAPTSPRPAAEFSDGLKVQRSDNLSKQQRCSTDQNTSIWMSKANHI